MHAYKHSDVPFRLAQCFGPSLLLLLLELGNAAVKVHGFWFRRVGRVGRTLNERVEACGVCGDGDEAEDETSRGRK